MNQLHGQKDPITKKYWNQNTQRWLKKPVRQTTKGQHKGKAKGAKVGQAIGKAKGTTYKATLAQLKAAHPDSWKSYGWLPISISLEDIQAAAQKHWHHSTTAFELDRALALSTLLIIMRCKVSSEQKRRAAYGDGFANLHSNDLKYFVGVHYRKYLHFFRNAGYIRPFTADWENKKEAFCPNAFSKSYKFLPKLLSKAGDNRMFQRVEYQSARMLVRLFKRKHKRKQQLLKQAFRQKLSLMVYKMAACIDVENFTAWALANPHEFTDREQLNNTIIRVNEMAMGDVHVTAFDAYGERFHSCFTNIKKVIRQFITIGEQPVIELDLKGSQFFFFACMVLYPAQCMAVLGHGMKQGRLREVMHLMKHFYSCYSDVKEFVHASLCSNIYRKIGKRYDGQFSKNEVKDLCFRALFSRSGQSKEAKQTLRQHYPNVVRLCEQINNKAQKDKKANALAGTQDAAIHSVPQLLQRLESRILIDMVAMQAADSVQHAYTTVHDSFLISADDVPLFKELIRTTFTALGLPVPLTSQK